MFVIQVDKSVLTIIEREILVSGAVSVYPVRFNFSNDWKGFSRVAIFYNNYEENPRKYSVLIDDSGMAYIPSEVLTDVDGTVYVGVCGESDSSQHLPTVIASLGIVQQGICDESSVASDPTPSIYQQILAQLASIKSDIDSGKLRGPEGKRGARGEPGVPGIPGPPGTIENLQVDPKTMTYDDSILSVKDDVIVREVDLATWEQMTEDEKKGLVFVKMPNEDTYSAYFDNEKQ